MEVNIMKKYIISVLLVMVVLFTMTACSNSNNHLAVSPSTEPSETLSVEAEVETEVETTAETEAEAPTLRYLTRSQVEELGAEEISDFFAEMVSISETETLSADEMDLMGYNFFNIFNENPACDQDELEAQSYKAFCNIYEQAIESDVPLEKLSSWTHLPVTSILEKYFSSNNFEIPENACCYALWILSEEDVTKVAESFFKNPVMSVNTRIPCIVIMLDYNNSATDMAWLHFEELSKSNSPKTSKDVVSFTEQVCGNILTLNDHMEKASKIAENILENPYYDMHTKYYYFCNTFYSFAIRGYTDDTIANIAIDSLFELAENADEETCNQLKELAENLYADLATQLLDVL